MEHFLNNRHYAQHLKDILSFTPPDTPKKTEALERLSTLNKDTARRGKARIETQVYKTWPESLDLLNQNVTRPGN